MKIVRSIGLVVAGLTIGVPIGSSIKTVEAQTGASESRLIYSYVKSNGDNSELTFVKDLRTSGCWLAVVTRGSIVSLAVAPTEACTFK